MRYHTPIKDTVHSFAFLMVLWFLPTSQKCDTNWLGYAKFLMCGRVYKCEFA